MYHCKTSRKPKLHTMLLCLMLAVTLALLTIPAAAVKHTDYVADPDGTLSETTIAAIKTINERLYEEKELRIAVCLTDGTGGESIVNFSRALYDDWKLTDGVLLVFDLSTQVYYGIQSLNIDDVLTNSVLKNIFDQVTEVEFKEGNVDKAVMNTVDALAEFIDANVESTNTPAPTAPTETDESGEETPEEEPSGFVTFMKVVLWTILILVLLAAAVFVAALFNDDLGDFVRTYIFRRNTANPPPISDYYDDRLYGQPTRNPNNPYSQMNRQPSQRQPRPGYDPYDDYSQQYRQTGGRPQNRPQQGQQGYPRQQRPQGQRPPQQGYSQQGYNQNYNRPQQGNPYQMQGQRSGQRPNGNRRPPNGQGY